MATKIDKEISKTEETFQLPEKEKVPIIVEGGSY